MDNLEEVDKFLEKYNLPKLNQEEIENMNKPITGIEIRNVIKNFPRNKSLGADEFTHELYQRFRGELTQTLKENCGEWQTLKMMLWGHHHPDTKPDKDAKEK